MKQNTEQYIGVKVADERIVEMCAVESGTKQHKIFTTVADNQTKASFRFYSGKKQADEWIFLEQIDVKGLHPAKAGEPSIHLFMEVNEKHHVQVRIKCQGVISTKCIMVQNNGEKRKVEGDRAQTPVAEDKQLSSDSGDTNIPEGGRVNRKKKSKRYRYAFAVCALLALVAVLYQFGPLPDRWITVPAKKTRGIAYEIKTLVREKIVPGQSVEDRGSSVNQIPQPHEQHASSSVEEEMDSHTEVSQKEENTQILEKREPFRTGPENEANREKQVNNEVYHQPKKEKSRDSMRVSSDKNENRPENSKKAKPQTAVAENKHKPVVYRITWGDTLWEITGKYYGNRYLYPYLAQKNSISDPDYIISGDKLILPEKIGSYKRTSRAFKD
ncbi:MAG: hypothetical protein ACOC7U_00055 [Spirochaetota bacterium]